MITARENRPTVGKRSGGSENSPHGKVYQGDDDRATVVRIFRRDEAIAARRRGEIIRLCEHWRRHGVLPLDVAGLAMIAANAATFRERQDLRASHVVDLCAGLIGEDEARRAVAVCQRAYHERAMGFRLVSGARAGQSIGLDRSDRRDLSIRTMVAVDETREERDAFVKARRRVADRERKKRARLASGAKQRALGLAIEEPWKALGISRATYFRKGFRETESPLTVLIHRLRTFSLTKSPGKLGESGDFDRPSPNPPIEKDEEIQCRPRVRAGRAGA